MNDAQLVDAIERYAARVRELEAKLSATQQQRDELKHACGLSMFALGMAIGEGMLKQDTEFYLQQALDECRAASRKVHEEAQR